MKQKKTQSKKVKTATRASASRPAPKKAAPATHFNPWSLSIYLYWFIILFFIAATFYILGRSHSVLHPTTTPDNVTVTEEALVQPNEYYESGKTKLVSGNIEDAIVDLTAAIDAENPSIDALILRGEAYMQSSNYSAALADFDRALELDSTNAVAYYDRALLNTRLENYTAALNDINNALAARATAPNEILRLRDLYARRGQLNLWLKNWEGAIADYTNSLARPDGNVTPNVYAERAEAYTAVGQYADAINDYTSAVRIISEQIQGASSASDREDLSSRAMTYFEKSAALNLKLGNLASARNDLDSAYTIANALNDEESMQRLQKLITELQAQ